MKKVKTSPKPKPESLFGPSFSFTTKNGKAEIVYYNKEVKACSLRS